MSSGLSNVQPDMIQLIAAIAGEVAARLQLRPLKPILLPTTKSWKKHAVTVGCLAPQNLRTSWICFPRRFESTEIVSLKQVLCLPERAIE
jgi:hypothetical protein